MKYTCVRENGNIDSSKKGNETIVLKSRPFTLTSVICKVFESIRKDQLISYLLDNDLICVKQLGLVLAFSLDIYVHNL